MELLTVFIATSLLFGAISYFLWNELQNEKRLREIFTRRTKECERQIINLIKDNIENKYSILELSKLTYSYINDIYELQNEVKALKTPKRKTTKKGSSKR